MILYDNVNFCKTSEIFKFDKQYEEITDDYQLSKYKLNLVVNPTKKDAAFYEFSKQYFKAVVELYSFCNNFSHIDSVIDELALPLLYFSRHSIELILKAFILKNVQNGFNKIIQCKHSLSELIESCKEKIDSDFFEEAKEYFDLIDIFDQKSDLFRYPFNSEFLKLYRNCYFDVLNMTLKMMYYYNYLHRLYDDKSYIDFDDAELKILEDAKNKYKGFIILKNHGYGNCYLWQLYDLDAYKQIEGYILASNILWYLIKENKMADIELPLMYSLRHLIELNMKNIILKVCPLIRDEINQDSNSKLYIGFMREHKLSDRLLKNTNLVMDKLIDIGDWDNEQYERFKRCVSYIDSFDSDDDYCRYPIDKGGACHNYENINMEAFCEIFYYCYDLIYSSEFALESLNDIAYEMLEDMKYSY